MSANITKAIDELEARLKLIRAGRSMWRETDADILAMRRAVEALRAEPVNKPDTSPEPVKNGADSLHVDSALVLPDPKGGCVCTWHSQDAGGGYFETLLEYEPACPEHSEHVYNPRTGIWEQAAAEPVYEYRCTGAPMSVVFDDADLHRRRCPGAVIERRRKAGPWEPVPTTTEGNPE